MNLTRRNFQTQLISALGLASASLGKVSANLSSSPTILLRSSWQTVNIGDIAHTPGLVHLIEQAIPEAKIILWSSGLDRGVKEMLQAHFPKLGFVQGGKELAEVIEKADFLLHGSGPSLVAQKDVAKWTEKTDKPYGVIGITLNHANEEAIRLLSGAKFVFFRDSISLRWAKERGIKCPIMEFGPDAAFATPLRNDALADQYLKSVGLHDKPFLCCIPRLRYTPYWEIKDRPKDPTRDARNEEMRIYDHAFLVRAIEHVVKESDAYILLCPEDMTQMKVGKENVLPFLSPSARERVVWRENYWLTDEAVSVYRKSLGLFGFEMHSPILCIGNGIPAIVARFPEQTSKGYMWSDIGLGEWLFQLDSPESMRSFNETVLALVKDPSGSKAKTIKARDFVNQRFRVAIDALKGHVS